MTKWKKKYMKQFHASNELEKDRIWKTYIKELRDDERKRIRTEDLEKLQKASSKRNKEKKKSRQKKKWKINNAAGDMLDNLFIG